MFFALSSLVNKWLTGDAKAESVFLSMCCCSCCCSEVKWSVLSIQCSRDTLEGQEENLASARWQQENHPPGEPSSRSSTVAVDPDLQSFDTAEDHLKVKTWMTALWMIRSCLLEKTWWWHVSNRFHLGFRLNNTTCLFGFSLQFTQFYAVFRECMRNLIGPSAFFKLNLKYWLRNPSI